MERDWDDISEIKKKAPHREEAKEEAKEEPEKPAEEIPEERKEPERETTEQKPQPKKPVEQEGQAEVLEKMKAAGITGAIVRADGVLVHSTMPMSDASAGLLASVSNVSDALLKRVGDSPKEIEITFQGQILVAIPIDGFLFCGMVKERDQKKTVRDFATKARALI